MKRVVVVLFLLGQEEQMVLFMQYPRFSTTQLKWWMDCVVDMVDGRSTMSTTQSIHHFNYTIHFSFLRSVNRSGSQPCSQSVIQSSDPDHLRLEEPASNNLIQCPVFTYLPTVRTSVTLTSPGRPWRCPICMPEGTGSRSLYPR